MSKINWDLKKIKVNDLKDWNKNPRKLTDKGLQDLKTSISKFGMAEPLVVNTDNMICGGHGRKKVLQELDIKEVNCYVPNRILTKKEFEELNIRLNKNIAGGWDFDILGELFDQEDLVDWGFEDFELGKEVDNLNDEWTDMPEYNSEDITSYRKIIVHFANEENLKAFFELVKQKHTDKTKFIWFPPVVGDSKKHEEYK